MNYNSTKGRPVQKGRMQDVVKPKRRLHTRLSNAGKAEMIVELKADLIHVLTDIGLVLQNTHEIARLLVNKGWIKTKKIEKDIQ